MKRTHLNFLIDALALVGMVLLLSTGLVLAHQLPPGSGGDHGAGSGRGAGERGVTLLWGWSRHQWGDLHYWIAYVLLAIVAVHVVLHWKWIVSVVRGKPSDASPYRLLAGVVSLVFLALLTALPLVSPTTRQTRGQLSQPAAAGAEQPAGGQRQDSPADHGAHESIRGSMTFSEIAEATGVPAAEMFRALGLPADTDPAAQAGRTLREHGLEMTDLREALPGASE